MSWARVGDELYDDPRTEAAGPEAMGLLLVALSWMARYRTDGWIRVDRCRRLVGPQRGKRLADRLVQAGWWEAPAEADGAYRLIGWEAFLLTAAEAEARSARAAEAGRKGGRARARKPPAEAPPAEGAERGADQGGGQGPDQDPHLTPDLTPYLQLDKSAETLDTSQATRAPDPVPVPDPARVSARDEGDHPGPLPDPSTPLFARDAPDPTMTPIPSSGVREKPAATDVERRIFDGYLRGRKRRGVKNGATPILDAKRLAIIRARMREGHTSAVLELAAEGIWASAWHVDAGYTGFDLALRNAENVERFEACERERRADLARFTRPPETQPEEDLDMPTTPEECEASAQALERAGLHEGAAAARRAGAKALRKVASEARQAVAS